MMILLKMMIVMMLKVKVIIIMMTKLKMIIMMITALDVSQSIGAGAGLDTSAMWNSAISKTLAR